MFHMGVMPGPIEHTYPLRKKRQDSPSTACMACMHACMFSTMPWSSILFGFKMCDCDFQFSSVYGWYPGMFRCQILFSQLTLRSCEYPLPKSKHDLMHVSHITAESSTVNWHWSPWFQDLYWVKSWHWVRGNWKPYNQKFRIRNTSSITEHLTCHS